MILPKTWRYTSHLLTYLLLYNSAALPCVSKTRHVILLITWSTEWGQIVKILLLVFYKEISYIQKYFHLTLNALQHYTLHRPDLNVQNYLQTFSHAAKIRLNKTSQTFSSTPVI